METLDRLLRKAFADHADRLAFRHRTGYRTFVWTYRDAERAVDGTIALLRERGVARGDRAILWAPNSPDWCFAFLACVLSGIVVVPLDAGGSRELAERVAAVTRPKLLLRGRFLPDLPSTPSLILDDLDLIIHKEGEGTNFLQSRLSERAEASEFRDKKNFVLEPSRSSDLVEIVFTSGTTGAPKGVPLTHQNIAANVSQILRAIPVSRDFRFLSLLPLSHLFEQVPGFLTPFLSGASVTFLRTLKPTEIIRAFHDARITHAVIVPRLLRLLRDGAIRDLETRRMGWLLRIAAGRALIRRRMVGRDFRYFVSGGAALEPDVEDFFWKIGIPVYQGYGLTETAPVLTANRPGAHMRRTVGQALPGVEVRVADDGEILARGDNVFSGYFENPDETANAFTPDGWFRTGDIGSLFARGFLTIHDRKKDLIVTAEGLNVYPTDIEDLLTKQKGVRDAAVIGKRSGAGETVHAALLLDPGTLSDPEEIVRNVNRSLPDYQRIVSWSAWPREDFPRTATLKIKKFEVRKAVEEGAPVSVPKRLSRLEQVIGRLTPKPIARTSRLGDDLGLSSIDRLELSVMIEQEFNVEVGDERFRATTTVGELEEALAARRRIPTPRFPRWTFTSAAAHLRRVLHEALVFPVLRRWTSRPRVTGAEQLRGLAGQVIFAANHVSHLDTPALWMALPRRFRLRLAVAALAEYFFPRGPLPHRLARRLQYALTVLTFAAYLMPRERGARQSLEFTGGLIDRGWSVIIYPEGLRSETGRLLPFKTGIGLLAEELRVPIVPVNIRGTFDILPVPARWPKRGRVEVAFGAPIVWRGESIVGVTDAIRNAVASLG